MEGGKSCGIINYNKGRGLYYYSVKVEGAQTVLEIINIVGGGDWPQAALV